MSSQSPTIKPRAALYLVAMFVFLVGAVVGIVLIVSGVRAYTDTIDNFARVPVNGEGVVSFSKAGKFTVFLEQPGIDSTGIFVPEIALELTEVAGGTPVALREYSGSGSYSNGGHEGVALKTFRIDEPGDYRLTASGQSTGEIAVGRSPFTKLGRGIAAGVVVGGLGFLIAGVIVIVLAVKRGGAKRRRRAAQYAGAGVGAGPYGGPGYGAQPQWQPQASPFGPGVGPPPPGPSPPPPFGPPPSYSPPGGSPPAPSAPGPPDPGPGWPNPPTGGDDATRAG